MRPEKAFFARVRARASHPEKEQHTPDLGSTTDAGY
jgi:hypothetical protein